MNTNQCGVQKWAIILKRERYIIRFYHLFHLIGTNNQNKKYINLIISTCMTVNNNTLKNKGPSGCHR